MDREILLHCHFFKNAGSSIDWALRRSFGDGFYENKEHFYSVHDWNTHLAGLVTSRTMTAISSHIFSLRPPTVGGVNFSVVAMVRHPIERVTSVAAFEKKQRYKNTFGVINNPSIGIREYVEAFLQDGTPASFRNIHTLRFAGRDNGLPVTEDDFLVARSTLEQCQSIGLVEFFDESMVLFEEILKPKFPLLDLSYIIQNVYQEPRGIDERIAELAAQLGHDLFTRLENKNVMDLKLYEMAKNRFHERIREIPNFASKLRTFRGRCLELR